MLSAKGSAPSVQIYSEMSGENFEASEADIVEFAKRIGIDLEKEPHLRYLAEEGLQHALPPHWKPCLDYTKKSWYYYNTKTLKSQWEHPLNEVYRNKVKEVRENIAMNRLQTTDLTGRPPKSLPPLKKLGAIRPPAGNNRLGPIGSSTPNANISVPDSNNKTNNNNTLLSGNSLGEFKSLGENGHLLQNPSSRVVKKPLGGLTLTGDGANFLKSADGSSSAKKKSIDPIIKPSTLHGVDDTPQSSLKSILTSSFNNQSKKGSGKDNKSFEPWKLSTDCLTDEEKQMLDMIGVSSIQQKPGVKFQLDENADIKFEISTDENDESEDRRLSKTEASDSEDSEDSESLLRILRKQTGNNKAVSRSSISSARTEPESKSNANERQFGAGEKASNSNLSETAVETMKVAMREHMENKLKEYQNELDKERREREMQIKQHLDLTVAEIQLEKESLLNKARQEFEQQKKLELEKVQRELQSMIQQEVEKLKESFADELERKKAEIKKHHEQVMEKLPKESLDEGKTTEDLQRQYSEETLKLQSELKNIKETLKEDQKKQIEQMKDYHKSFIEKLKADLKEEENRLQNEHKKKLAEVAKLYETETAELQAKLKNEQDLVLKSLMVEFEREKSAVEKELREGLRALNDDMKHIKSKVQESKEQISSQVSKTVVEKNLSHESNDELRALGLKYNQLEKKYNYLKKELRKLTIANSNENAKNANNNQNNIQHESNKNVSKVSIERSRGEVSPVRNVVTSTKSEPITFTIHQESELPESTSESQSESTFYPSSSVNRPADQNNSDDPGNSLQIKDIINDNNDRLADALKSLEVLKSQILDIKQDRESFLAPLPPPPKTSGRGSPRNHKKLVPYNSPATTARLGVTTKKKPVTPKTPTRQHNINNNNNKMPPPPPPSRLRSAKSTSELPGLIEDTEEPNEIVREAKEFIRTQKERLNLSTQPPMPSTWSGNNNNKGALRYSLDEISYPPSLTLRPTIDMYSETESSGVGSLGDLKSREKKQISKDIQAICSSLSNLDGQMRLMWSVVQGNAQDKSGSSSSITLQNNMSTLPKSARLPGGKQSFRPTPTSTNQNQPSFDLQSFATSCLSPNNRALIDTLKNTSNLPVGSTPSNIVTSLGRDLKKFKERQERILNQFSVQKNTPSDSSIQEKTKDLREWLEKF